MLVPVPDMVGLNVQGELETWRAEELSRSILYSRRVMDEMRVAVVEGFNRVPHGGLEVGGILLGKRDGDNVCILAQKAVPCGYALGPSYVLTDEDQERFKNALELAAANAGVTGMEPVGWYHSHTRSNIFLSERDLEIFNKFFPEPWQVALVLRPANLQPTAAGFFVRE
jgi:proteasome lid subunit RPN8/RPN11